MFLLFVTCCLRQPPCVCGQRSLRLELVDDIDSMSFAVSLTASFYAIIHAYMNESMNKGPWSWWTEPTPLRCLWERGLTLLLLWHFEPKFSCSWCYRCKLSSLHHPYRRCFASMPLACTWLRQWLWWLMHVHVSASNRYWWRRRLFARSYSWCFCARCGWFEFTNSRRKSTVLGTKLNPSSAVCWKKWWW